jgi:hypothetical protein
MADLTERVARVEEQSDAHIRTMDYLRQDMSALRHSMEALSAELRTEMASLSTGLRADMNALKTELRGDMAAFEQRFERRFDQMDVRFNWLMGVVVTSSIATVGAVAGAFWGLLQALR